MVVDSNEQQLSSKEIIEIATVETKTPFPPEQVYSSVLAEINQPNTRTYWFGNTIFPVIDAGNGQGFFRGLNADTADNYINNSIEFVKQAYEDGFDLLLTEFYDPTILNIFRAIAQNPPNEGMGYKVKQGDRGYQVTLQLGKGRQ
jgi:hypothetical protein